MLTFNALFVCSVPENYVLLTSMNDVKQKYRIEKMWKPNFMVKIYIGIGIFGSSGQTWPDLNFLDSSGFKPM